MAPAEAEVSDQAQQLLSQRQKQLLLMQHIQEAQDQQLLQSQNKIFQFQERSKVIDALPSNATSSTSMGSSCPQSATSIDTNAQSSNATSSGNTGSSCTRPATSIDSNAKSTSTFSSRRSISPQQRLSKSSHILGNRCQWANRCPKFSFVTGSSAGKLISIDIAAFWLACDFDACRSQSSNSGHHSSAHKEYFSKAQDSCSNSFSRGQRGQSNMPNAFLSTRQSTSPLGSGRQPPASTWSLELILDNICQFDNAFALWWQPHYMVDVCQQAILSQPYGHDRTSIFENTDACGSQLQCSAEVCQTYAPGSACVFKALQDNRHYDVSASSGPVPRTVSSNTGKRVRLDPLQVFITLCVLSIKPVMAYA